MADERRYREEEVKEIFEQAADARDTNGGALSPGEGLTLRELQDIGLEVGLSPHRIFEAASSVDLRRGALPSQTSLGMPISVGRVVELPRALTEREWDLLVTELRQTFKAKGKKGVSGSVRNWYNGNLHAYVEPTENGYQLRMGTLKGNAKPMNIVGIMGVGVAVLLSVALVLTGNLRDDLMAAVMFALAGTGALVSNMISLPRWARRRQQQMEHIAGRARAMIGAGRGGSD